MNHNDIPRHLMVALVARGHTDEQIEAMEPKRMFHEYCAWNGLIGYSRDLWDMVIFLNAEKVREESF